MVHGAARVTRFRLWRLAAFLQDTPARPTIVQYLDLLLRAWRDGRRSRLSYRVAETQNVAQVALEAGNSPQMIFKHYRELVRPADAKTRFALAPGGEEKVIVSRK